MEVNILEKMWKSTILPMNKIIMKQSVTEEYEDIDLYLYKGKILLFQNVSEGGYNIHIRPDLISTPALATASFYSSKHLVDEDSIGSSQANEIHINNDEGMMQWIAAMTARSYEGTEEFQYFLSAMRLANYFNLLPLFKRSIIPVHGKKFATLEIKSHLGRVFLNDDEVITTGVRKIEFIRFPDIANYWYPELMDRFDKEDACRCDESGAEIYPFREYSNMRDASEMIKRVFSYHLPRHARHTSYIIDESRFDIRKSPLWYSEYEFLQEAEYDMRYFTPVPNAKSLDIWTK